MFVTVGTIVAFVRTRATDLSGPGTNALIIGLPVGLLIAWFIHRLGAGARVSVTDTPIVREVLRPDVVCTTYDINQIERGILRAQVRFGKFRAIGAELILFIPGGRYLWLAMR